MLFVQPINSTAKNASTGGAVEKPKVVHVEKPTEVPSSPSPSPSPSELRLPGCGETAEKLISVGGRSFERTAAVGDEVEHATIVVAERGI